MLKKTITYKDYFDIERTEDFYFNLSKAELLEMEMGAVGGNSEMLKKIIAAKDQATLIRIFKEFVLKAYGEKSEDGRRFIKSEELSKAFSETPAYEIIYMELVTDAQAAADFVKGVAPADISEKIDTANI